MQNYSDSLKNEQIQSSAAGHARRSKKNNCCGQAKAAPLQRQQEDGELMQGSFDSQAGGESGMTASPGSVPGIPGSVQTKMEKALNTDLSGVRVHANSSKATQVGALAYTQGTDIHVAPGHYSPNTSKGKKLLGHELAHVAQQMAGRVKPTGSVGGMPLNDSPSLEAEADSLGAKAI